MNAHMTTPEYRKGYQAFGSDASNPYEPGTTSRSLWAEGFKDACDDNEEWQDACEIPIDQIGVLIGLVTEYENEARARVEMTLRTDGHVRLVIMRNGGNEMNEHCFIDIGSAILFIKNGERHD